MSSAPPPLPESDPSMKIGNFNTHPAADIFPLLDGRAFSTLVEDIRFNGLNIPITLFDGMVLDGRSRLLACIQAGVEPRFETFDGDPWELSWSANVERRHLEPGARVVYRLKWESERGLWDERRQERKEAADMARSDSQRGRAKNVGDNIATDVPRSEDSNIRGELAHAAGVSPITAQKAITVREEAPELLDAVAAGKVSLNQAYRTVKRNRAIQNIEEEPMPLPTGPFRVIVADPPWDYQNRKNDGAHRAANAYPDMTTDEICALPVGSLAHEDCILWLWTTNAFMRDAFRVIDAWGFQEKTILTWAKPKIGLGDWLRGSTEHCLMAVRGHPVVNLTNEATLLEGKAREHSRKPEEFYELVERLCPGSKVELFGRQQRNGWTTWGAEADAFNTAD